MIEWWALELHKKYQFSHVVCLGEEDIIRCARLRQILKINSGQTVENAKRYRDKVIMKDVLRLNGVATPDFYIAVEKWLLCD